MQPQRETPDRWPVDGSPAAGRRDKSLTAQWSARSDSAYPGEPATRHDRARPLEYRAVDRCPPIAGLQAPAGIPNSPRKVAVSSAMRHVEIRPSLIRASQTTAKVV